MTRNRRRERTSPFLLPLTAHQIEILQTLAPGLTLKQTAKVFGLSNYTIKSIMDDVHEKLGTNKLHGAVYAAMKKGLIK